MNPLSAAKLLLLGELCKLSSTSQVLDLGCGKGEMLCRWAASYGCRGLGVDVHPSFVGAARDRARALGVEDRVRFEERDAKGFAHADRFDVAGCVGATWIGGGPAATVELLRSLAHPGALLLLGDVFFHERPSAGVEDLLGQQEEIRTLAETVQLLEATGSEVIEMVLSNTDDWDRYQASQWRNVSDWLVANPDDPQADEFRLVNQTWKQAYLDYGRHRWGWGVFVLRA